MAEQRLIDANALTELEALEHSVTPAHDGDPWYRVKDVWDCIDSAPTVEVVKSRVFTDVREVGGIEPRKNYATELDLVRCKDCKYGGDRPSSFWKEHIVCTRRKVVDYVKPDDFCSYGERGKDNG